MDASHWIADEPCMHELNSHPCTVHISTLKFKTSKNKKNEFTTKRELKGMPQDPFERFSSESLSHVSGSSV